MSSRAGGDLTSVLPRISWTGGQPLEGEPAVAVIDAGYLRIDSEQFLGEAPGREWVIEPYEPGLLGFPRVPVRQHEYARDARVPSFRLSRPAAEEAVLRSRPGHCRHLVLHVPIERCFDLVQRAEWVMSADANRERAVPQVVTVSGLLLKSRPQTVTRLDESAYDRPRADNAASRSTRIRLARGEGKGQPDTFRGIGTVMLSDTRLGRVGQLFHGLASPFRERLGRRVSVKLHNIEVDEPPVEGEPPVQFIRDATMAGLHFG